MSSNPTNLIILKDQVQYDLPVLLNLNARSLSSEKSDELCVVAENNHASLMCVTETWFKDYVPTDSVSIPGFICERKDRTLDRAGGVACYIKTNLSYERLHDLEDDFHEALWLRTSPKKLPRKYSCVLVGCIYHPPSADSTDMRDNYIISCIDSILRRYPDCDVILAGDFNQMGDQFLRTHYGYVQVVDKPTRQQALLDKIWTNMTPLYSTPVILSELGSFPPLANPNLDRGSKEYVRVRCMGHAEKVAFATAVSCVRWEPLFHMNTCDEQFNYFQTVMQELIENCFPHKTVVRHSSDKPWVTDHFRQLVRRRQRPRMNGDDRLAKRLRNKVNREAKRLRHDFYQTKVSKLEESSSREWWKNMKSLMGFSTKGRSELQGLANTVANGDIAQLANNINAFLLSVTSDLPRLNAGHPIFQLTDPLPTELTITVEDTERALLRLKVNKATGPDNIPAWLLKEFARIMALTAIYNSSLREGVLPSL